jgi:hypothetical protein
MKPLDLTRAVALAVTVASSTGVLADTTPSHARAAVDAYLALWSADAPASSVAAPFGKDMVLRYRHGVPELNAEVLGRTSAVRQIRAVAQLGRDWQFRDVWVHPTPDPQVYFANYTARGSAANGTAAPVERNVVLRVDLDRDGQVARIVEYANPAMALTGL